MTRAQSTLSIDSLTIHRAGRRVVAGFTLGLAAGEASLLKGPNGVGKSTLLRALAGFLPVAGGGARLGDVSLARDRAGFQERVAYAGHLDAVKPQLTVEENLALWAALEGTEDRVGPALERFRLDRLAGRPAAQCSAGQKRRLGLARLLVARRALWLMDEPTVSLDTASAATVAEAVRDHLRDGGMALVATHIALGLEDARVVEMTPPAEDAPEGAPAADPFLDGAW